MPIPSATEKQLTRLDTLLSDGFDRSTLFEGCDCCDPESCADDGACSVRIRVACSQCDACTINGIACHEHKCPNTVRADWIDDSEDEDDA